MYCSNCGKSILDESKFCNECGHKTDIGDTKNTSISKSSPETVIMQGLCNRVKSAIYVQNGKAILTSHRFIYLKHSFIKILAIGAFVNFTSGDIDFDIPISNISHIDNGRQGISKTIRIHTKTGETYNFYFTKRVEWEIAFNNAIR
jgi:hypothetical protein